MHKEEILIPESRTREVIKAKKKIESACNVSLEIQKDGSVIIFGKDALNCNTAERIAKAIARGFKLKDALTLLDETCGFEIVSLTDFKKGTRKNRQLMRSRVIGTDGKVKKTIETMTKTKLVISGKTVAIVGKIEDAFLARRAVEMIFEGHKQTSAYKFLRESLENSQ